MESNLYTFCKNQLVTHGCQGSFFDRRLVKHRVSNNTEKLPTIII
jgi:hypothetical protein